MAYQVLARKWRPRDFSEMVGQEHVVRALTNALDNDRLHHAFLFAGTRGVGKTTLARILAKALNCLQGISSTPCGECEACQAIDAGRFVDLIEVDAASRTKVDDTRELLDNVQYAPSAGRYKVYLIDEVHMLSNHSFNALLKTLEEPPPHVKFLLATTEPQKLPVTVLSRCLRFNLKRLPAELIADQVMHILTHESVASESAAIKLIARAADGSMRDALSLLDQGIAYGAGELGLTNMQAMLGTLDSTQVHKLLHAVAYADGRAMLQALESLDAKAPDYSAVLDEMAAVIQRVALVQTLGEGADGGDDAEAIRSLAEVLSPEDAQLYYQIMLIGKRDLPLAPEPRGGFEMIMLRLLAFRPAADSRTATPKLATAQAEKAAPTPPAQAMAVPQGDKAASASPAAKDEPAAAAIEIAEWDRLIRALKLKGMARELAVNCLFQSREAELVKLRIDTAHRELVTEKGVKRLETALSAYYDAELRVRIEVGGLGAQTPAKRDAARHQARLEGAREAIANDPNVRALGELFDAEVKPDSIKPVD